MPGRGLGGGARRAQGAGRLAYSAAMPTPRFTAPFAVPFAAPLTAGFGARRSWLSALALLTAGLLLGTAALAQTPPPRLPPDSGPWDSGAGFRFDLRKKEIKHTRQSVSGMACNLDAQGRRICLMAFDEGAQARYAYLDGQTLVPDPAPVALRPGSGEIDAEGAATDGRHLYVTGSHSAKRGDCASNPDSRHVLRLRLDAATGRAVRPAGGTKGAPGDYADSGRLWALMQAQPALAPYVGERKCLGEAPPDEAPHLRGQQGANIEGLAIKDGRLYFGFRSPVLQDAALVLGVQADALFGAQAAHDPRATVTRLALGPHRGIRDMVAVQDGFLLLAGPDDSRAHRDAGWVVAWWDGQGAAEGAVVQPRLLAALDLQDVRLRKCDKELKPEAMTVLEETPAAYKLLVLSDGLCDGGPLAFTVAR